MIFSVNGLKLLISNTEPRLFNIVIVRSTPIPVSTFFCFNFLNPSFVLLYSIKTLFHISKYFPQLHPGLHSLLPFLFPETKKNSWHGPQGPYSETGPQKFSLPRKKIFFFFIPNDS